MMITITKLLYYTVLYLVFIYGFMSLFGIEFGPIALGFGWGLGSFIVLSAEDVGEVE